MGTGVGIEQQFIAVETVTRFGFVRSMDAVTIELTGVNPFDVAVKNLVRVFWQLDARSFLFARLVEEADLHLAGISREQGKIRPLAIPMGTTGVRQAFAKFVVAHVNAPRAHRCCGAVLPRNGRHSKSFIAGSPRSSRSHRS